MVDDAEQSVFSGVWKVSTWWAKTTFLRRISSEDVGASPRGTMLSVRVSNHNLFMLNLDVYQYSTEVTGCDLSQLPTNETGIEKTKFGANSFRLRCNDPTQNLVQEEAPYHQASQSPNIVSET